MQKLNELLNSGKINAIEYYNYFKNKRFLIDENYNNNNTEQHRQDDNDTTIQNSKQSSIKQQQYQPVLSTELKRNSISTSSGTVHGYTPSSSYHSLYSFSGTSNTNSNSRNIKSNNKFNNNTNNTTNQAANVNNKSKFNAYLMSTNNDNETINTNSKSPPPPSLVTVSRTSPSNTFTVNVNSNKYQQSNFASSQPPLYNTLFDKKKEDAINRIIRNERIKEIRTKIYEHELLREYQKCYDNITPAAKPLNNKNFTQNDSLFELNSNNDEDSFENASIDSCGTDYGFESIDNDDELEVCSNSNESTNNYHDIIPYNSNGVFTNENCRNYKTKKPSLPGVKPVNANGTSLKKSMSYCDYLSLTDNSSSETIGSNSNILTKKSFIQNGLSMDDLIQETTNELTSSDSIKSITISPPPMLTVTSNVNNNTTPKQQQQRTSSRTKSVKPGFELYQIGNLNSSQSTFQLKVSIISAELKNIINVLKQVNKSVI